MSIQVPQTDRRGQRRLVTVGAAVLVVLLAIAVWALARSNGSGSSAADVASAGATPTGAAPASGATPGPTVSAKPTSTAPPATADPVPTAAAAPASAAAAPAGDRERPAVAPAAVSSVAGGPTVHLSNVGHVDGQAVGPGDIAGPALRMSIVIENAGADDLDLSLVAVNAFIGTDRRPAGTLTQPGGAPFNGTLKPGQSATGVYLFTVPVADQHQVTLVVDYRAGQPSAVFTGAF